MNPYSKNGMNIAVLPSAEEANEAAARSLGHRLLQPGARNLMVAGGNTPLQLYQRIAQLNLRLDHLRVFVLDEYVGVPLDEARNCSNLLRHTVAEAWKVPLTQFFALSSVPLHALISIREHERRIAEFGGLDVVVLGLGQNGHLGFNEPGSSEESIGRLVDLDPISVEANRTWFEGVYAPAQGVTAGLKTLLSARAVFLLAYGPSKACAVRAMIEGPRSPACPASFLQHHPAVSIFLDTAAGAQLSRKFLAGARP